MAIIFYECYRNVAIYKDPAIPSYLYVNPGDGRQFGPTLSAIKNYADMDIAGGWVPKQCPTCKERFLVKNPDGHPANGAKVTLNKFSCTTGADGYCTISGVSFKTYSAIATHRDYEDSLAVPVYGCWLKESDSLTELKLLPPLPPPIIEIPISLSGPSISTFLNVLAPPVIQVALSGGTPSVCVTQLIKTSLLGGLPTVKVSVPLEPAMAPLVDSLVEENTESLADAFSFARYAGCKTAGFIRPPYICIVCGARLNSDEAFISHMTSHLFAYDAQGGT